MSDTTPAGYFKYFNKKDVQTRLKLKKGQSNITLTAWKKGKQGAGYVLENYEEIIVLKKDKIDDLDGKYEITCPRYKGVVFLVARSMIEKPKTGTEAIKPQNFSLDGINLTIQDIQRLVKSNMDKIQELKEVIQEYLIFLTQAAAKENNSTQFKHFKKIPEEELKRIAKNFGEVLSGIAVLSNPKLFPNLDIKKTDKVFFPKSLTEGLYDFSVVGKVGGKDKQKYLFSVKAMLGGAKPNTVKPEHILELINSSPKLKSQYSKTHQYMIAKILAEGSIRYGPLEVMKYLISKNKRLNYTKADFSKLQPKAKAIFQKYKTITIKEIDAIISDDTKKRTTATDDKLKTAETYIEYVSKYDIDFTEFFLDAISTRVYYIIATELNSLGVKWATVGDKGGINHKKIERVTMRGKKDLNGRMGFDL